MGALTEVEIFDRMLQSFKIAAECADKLAVSSRKGPTYEKLREHLALIEGCCRQASAWRSDTRWLKVGLVAAAAHEKAGGWLRGYKDPVTGLRVAFAASDHNPLFIMLANNLRQLAVVAEDIKLKATGIRGDIMPTMGPAPHRDNVPVGWRKTPGGLLVQ